ncbi:hypothetical protein [Microbacterium aerolatum]|uniref:hypothetical protein n=1 Tax=Microbacterium aerolatum TaxID=153731 RepID=UPI00384A91F6
MAIEEEIARVIDKAFDDWQGEESEAAFVTARLTPLLNRVRAEALKEAAKELEERWTTYSVGVQTHPAGVATISPRGSVRTGQEFAKVLRARADRIEQNSEGNET